MLPLPRACWGCQVLLEPHTTAPQLCPQCSLGVEPLDPDEPNQSAILGLYAYQGVMIDLLNRLKLHGQRQAARPLGELLWQAPGNPLPGASWDYLICVPLHPKRQRARGFNQCEQILHWAYRASGQARKNTLPAELPDLLHRYRSTPPQRELSREARLNNVRDCFVARTLRHVPRDSSILVMDDVSTTGATLGQALAALSRAGYRKCQGLALMRADSVKAA